MKNSVFLFVCFALVSSSSTSILRGQHPEEEPRFRWKPALTQSVMFLGVKHGYRIAFQPDTRAKLRGPFLRDYLDSIKGFGGWHDNDEWLANYLGHPMQGSVSGYIQVQNDPRGITAEFGSSKHYWQSRLRAMGWSAVYSAQYEFGPLSDAAIGNSGKTPGTKGAVDLVVTPTLGMAWMVTEDVLDRHVILSLENHVKNPAIRSLARTWLNPTRSFANILRFRAPWHRDTRAGVLKY